ncbi:MAG TPA: hypothetical protein VGD78_18850 [Chthoniobacterales bacterium]
MKHLYVLLFWLAVTSIGRADEVTQLIARADQAEMSGDNDEALQILKQATGPAQEDPQILKRLSRLYTRKIEDAGNPAESRKYAELAVKLGEEAVQQLPNDAQLRIGLAAAYGKIIDYVDARARIEYSKKVHAEAVRGLALDPNSDFGYLILARWNFSMATINPLMRGLAEVVYGQFPAASKEESLADFKKAIALAPDRIIHHAEYAKVLEALGDRPLAREQWQKVSGLKPIDAQDRRYQVMAASHLGRG